MMTQISIDNKIISELLINNLPGNLNPTNRLLMLGSGSKKIQHFWRIYKPNGGNFIKL